MPVSISDRKLLVIGNEPSEVIREWSIWVMVILPFIGETLSKLQAGITEMVAKIMKQRKVFNLMNLPPNWPTAEFLGFAPPLRVAFKSLWKK